MLVRLQGQDINMAVNIDKFAGFAVEEGYDGWWLVGHLLAGNTTEYKAGPYNTKNEAIADLNLLCLASLQEQNEHI